MESTRRKLPTEAKADSVVSIPTLVIDYMGHKSIMDAEKKDADRLNKEIKVAMKDQGVSSIDCGDYKASVTYSENEKFNEEQAIEILRKNLSEEDFALCVKKREYIDDDGFESLVYNKSVDPAILAPAREKLPPTATLRVTAVKKNKD